MLEKMSKICEIYQDGNDNVRLFAVLKMDDLVDKWSVIIATDKNQTQDERREEYAKISKLLTEKLEASEIRDIARIGFFDMSTHLIEESSKYQAGSKIEKTKVNGNFVYEGYILCLAR